MNKKNVYIDLHILQTVPPSCVNRDDTGSPKTAVYGGTVRARVSSQAWKHAMRKMFKDEIFEKEIGMRIRTSSLVEKIVDELDKLGVEDSKKKEKVLKKFGDIGVSVKTEKKDKGDTLIFVTSEQIKAMAKVIAENNNEKDAFKQALREKPSIDMLLFGRMIATKKDKNKDTGVSLNYDATAQVAHSISTHTVHNEYDYFTAVDDCAPEDNAGAGHLGTVEYNSATLYRYATVNAAKLAKILGKEDAANTIKGFAEAFIRSMPTGKQNTFANRTLPDAIYVTVRNDQPVNLCGAFEKPVYTSAGGYAEPSEKALVDYAKKVYKDYVNEPEAAFAVGDNMEELAETMPLKELLEKIKDKVSECLEGEM